MKSGPISGDQQQKNQMDRLPVQGIEIQPIIATSKRQGSRLNSHCLGVRQSNPMSQTSAPLTFPLQEVLQHPSAITQEPLFLKGIQ